MANTDTLAPSDILASASDELGSTLATVRGQALAASGDKRDQLFDLFDQLLRRHRKLMFRDLKVIDQDPEISRQPFKTSPCSRSVSPRSGGR